MLQGAASSTERTWPGPARFLDRGGDLEGDRLWLARPDTRRAGAGWQGASLTLAKTVLSRRERFAHLL